MPEMYWHAACFTDTAMWEAALVAQIDPPTDAIVGDWLSVPDVAGRLGLPVSRVKQLLRDRKLLAVQRPSGEFAVPARFLDGDQVIHGLGGTLTLLFDCGFTEQDALSWLFTADESLPGTPVQALAEHRRTEVNRRAQALAF
jgi:Rv2175c C-terminal domain of unknown function